MCFLPQYFTPINKYNKTCCVLIMLYILLSHLVSIKTLRGPHHYLPHVTQVQSKTQRSKTLLRVTQLDSPTARMWTQCSLTVRACMLVTMIFCLLIAYWGYPVFAFWLSLCFWFQKIYHDVSRHDLSLYLYCLEFVELCESMLYILLTFVKFLLFSFKKLFWPHRLSLFYQYLPKNKC